MFARQRHTGAELSMCRSHASLQVVCVVAAARCSGFGRERARGTGVLARTLVLGQALGRVTEREEQIAAQVVQARKLMREPGGFC
jgi:hypothetical protein